jgi:hypothetical protein
MKSRIVLGSFVLVLLASVAHAQAPLGYQSFGGMYGGHSDNPNGPTVSPYLNLLQNNNLGGANYQTLVKPLIDQGNAIDRQGGGLQRLQQQVNRQQQTAYSGRMAATGHQTQFLNHTHFFPANRTQPGVAR